ncbi:pyridoxal 5'-phosphate synthase lyase subunit PdxS, partial [Bacillus cereus group sp. N21]|nr:pyridoxal 5'-phosphate synthase lyase subunit PdxS [Bacillus cereus group sp. N21]
LREDEFLTTATPTRAPYAGVLELNRLGRLPVVNFAAGGVATPADAALMMQLGADGVFVGSGIFKSENPEKFARAIVEATTEYEDYEL